MLVPAHLSDLPDILSLCACCRDILLSQGITQWDETYPDKAIFQADITRSHTFLQRDGSGRLVAYFAMDTEDDLQWAIRTRAYAPPACALLLHRLCIHPQLQGRGLGRSCIQFAEKQARALGYRALLLTVFAQNKRAISFYQSLGYLDCGALLFEENGDWGLTMYKPLQPLK